MHASDSMSSFIYTNPDGRSHSRPSRFMVGSGRAEGPEWSFRLTCWQNSGISKLLYMIYYIQEAVSMLNLTYN